ncbi:MAG TPA: dihydrofolate reductase [Bacteroidales bacterium]|nr:dihydrofolate reductase [Bacteroidales bacterium]
MKLYPSLMIFLSLVVAVSCNETKKENPKNEIQEFDYQVDRFADIEVLRFQVDRWNEMSLQQKTLIYYLSEAALCGRDIVFDQNYEHNLDIKDALENIIDSYSGDKSNADFEKFMVYVKRFWFSNGIHHHYSNAKFFPEISKEYFTKLMSQSNPKGFHYDSTMNFSTYTSWITDLIFNPSIAPWKIAPDNSPDLILNSASNFYKGVTQKEAEGFYAKMEKNRKIYDPERPVSLGLNSQLVKEKGKLVEKKYQVGGMYSEAITQIVFWLNKALTVTENDQQKAYIEKLISYYQTGDLKTWDDYNILWVKDLESHIDFINGFIEVYSDPIQKKGTWESIVNFKDVDNTKRTETISKNAQWFEDHSPIAPQFKKKEVKGVAAKVIIVAFLGGESYPTTPLGINLPNANWIRKEYGSKSVTMSNIMYAYNQAGLKSGINDEFYYSNEEIEHAEKYGYITYNLFVDMHECLGHGSGQMAPGVSDASLKQFHSVIEECRADLFALYFLGDPKIVDLGIVNHPDAYKAEYYRSIVNGMMLQLNRINLGDEITQTHMRDRAIIANWCYEKGKAENVIELIVRDGKTYIKINDYEKLRNLYGDLLAYIQDIKSNGKYQEAKQLVEKYGIKINPEIHKEVKDRYALLDLAPYSGFINPKFVITTENGQIKDIQLDYSQNYVDQMLEYGKKYRLLKK